MKLTYTIEIEYAEPADITPEHQSAWLIARAFEMVGDDLGGQTIEHLSIWPHDDATPDDTDLHKTERLPIPDETCPTCGIQQFSKAAD